MTGSILVLECVDDHLGDLEQAADSKIRKHAGSMAAEVVRLGGSIVQRPWVADITSGERRFLQGIKDFTGAHDGIGSRGVVVRFVLLPGRRYEVNEPTGGPRSRRYTATVENGEVVEL